MYWSVSLLGHQQSIKIVSHHFSFKKKKDSLQILRTFSLSMPIICSACIQHKYISQFIYFLQRKSSNTNITYIILLFLSIWFKPLSRNRDHFLMISHDIVENISYITYLVIWIKGIPIFINYGVILSNKPFDTLKLLEWILKIFKTSSVYVISYLLLIHIRKQLLSNDDETMIVMIKRRTHTYTHISAVQDDF